MTSSQPSGTPSAHRPSVCDHPLRKSSGTTPEPTRTGDETPGPRNYADRMRRLRRWYAWLVRHAPRLRDILYVGFALLTVVAQAASGRAGWDIKDWYVLGAGVVASVALFWRRRFPVTVTAVSIAAMLTGGIFVPMG